MADDRMLSDEILLGLIKKNGGSGGTTDYEALENLPEINGVELKGNKSLSDLGIASAQSVSNITNGESINNFAGVETALGNKQGKLNAGDYISIANDEISVDREIPSVIAEYEIKTEPMVEGQAFISVTKTVNGEVVLTQKYGSSTSGIRQGINFDENIYVDYTKTADWSWTYKLRNASVDHEKDYTQSWHYTTTVDYTEEFYVTDHRGDKLVIKSELDTALETKQDALTFDDTPTDGSNNPVKSNGVYDSEKDIYATMGEMGAKNLIPYPYYQTTQTVAGITTTDNGDGTLTFNGTCTANGVIFRLASNDANIEIPLGKDRYILTWVESSEYHKYFRIDIGLKKSDNTTDVKNGEFGIIEINNTNNQYKGIFAVSVYSASGLTVSNLTFKPMLRLASDTDDTFQPYAKTNKQLTDDVALLESKKTDTDMVAADFDATASYTAGNYCVQDGKLYKFKNNHSGAWSSADVDEVKITGELSALKNGLNNLIVSDIKSSAGQTVAAGDDSMFTIDVTKQGYTPIFYTAINTQNSRLVPYYYALNGNTLSVAVHNYATGSLDGAVSALVLYRHS